MTTSAAPVLVFDPSEHRYTLDGRELPGVTHILQDARLADFSAPWFTEATIDRGSLVHAAIALDNEGALDDESLDPQLVGYVAGWRRYLEESGAIVEHFETPVCDPIAGYAGTLDAIVIEPHQVDKNARTLIDIKPALYPSVGPQTAAYARAAQALYPTRMLFWRSAVVLPGDGSYTHEPLTDRSDEQTFLAAVRIFQWRSAHVTRHR